MLSTKEKLITSAIELFSKNGIDGTSTASIAKNAGVATGTLFVHFASKKELLHYLYILIRKESFDFVLDDLDTSLTIEEKLKEVYSRMFLYFFNSFDKLTFMNAFEASIYIKDIDIKAFESGLMQFYEMFEMAKKEKVVKDREYGLLSAIIGGLFFSLSKYVNEKGKDKIDECVKIIFKAIS